MIAGGLGMFWRKMWRLMKYGSQTVNSWLMNLLVGTEKTSVGDDVSGVIGLGEFEWRVRGSLTVQLFQGELLGFSDEAEDHEPSD
jgi:hypothetical protein